MKKLLSLILALVCVTSLFIGGASVNAIDALGIKLRDSVSMLDQLFMEYSSYEAYVANQMTNLLFKNADYGAESMIVEEEKFEAILNSLFVTDDTLVDAIRTTFSYDESNGTYTLFNGGGFGGILPSRQYAGYKKVGDRYDVYFAEIEYSFLRDVLPEGVTEYEYAEELGYPETIEYNGVVYENGPDGFFAILGYKDSGKKYTVEIVEADISFENEYISYFKFLSDVLPEDVDVNEYAASLGNPETIEYNGEVFEYNDWNGYFIGDANFAKTTTVELKGEVVRLVSYGDYTEADLPESFDKFDSSEVFEDLKVKSWSKEGIDFVVSSGYMSGTNTAGTIFDQEGTMTRAMLVSVLWRIAGSPEPETENPFTDLQANQTWYHKAVIWAAENEIVAGTNAAGTTFSPTLPVKREQMATFLFRFANYMGAYTEERADIDKFPDVSSVSSWARDAFAWANAEGIIAGAVIGGEACLAPAASATREQVATILMRFCMWY